MPVMVLLNFSCRTPMGCQRSLSLLPLALILERPGGSKYTQVVSSGLLLLQPQFCRIFPSKKTKNNNKKTTIKLTKNQTSLKPRLFAFNVASTLPKGRQKQTKGHFQRCKILFKVPECSVASWPGLSKGQDTLGTGVQMELKPFEHGSHFLYWKGNVDKSSSQLYFAVPQFKGLDFAQRDSTGLKICRS